MSPVAWNLNSTLINNPWTKERIKMKIRKYFELNNNENKIYKYLWDVVKTVRYDQMGYIPEM